MDFLEQLFELYYQKRKAQDDLETMLGLELMFEELLNINDMTRLKEQLRFKKSACRDRICQIKEKN